MNTQQLAEQVALELATSNVLDTQDIIKKALDQVREQTIKERSEINEEELEKWANEEVAKIKKSIEGRYQDYNYKINYLDEAKDCLIYGYRKAKEEYETI